MRKSKLIIVRIWEGIGNQLFQYAYARALKKKGYDVRLDINKSYASTYEGYENDIRQNHIQYYNITVPTINVEEYGKYDYIKRNGIRDKIIFFMAKHGLWKYKFYEETTPDYSIKTDHITGNYYIKGWFQDERYFKNIRNILLKEIMPKEKILISGELQRALQCEESVSIHIRRGDFVKASHVLPKGYYKVAVKKIKEYYNNPYFLIFSDDLEWVRRNLNFEDNCIYVNEDRKLQDYEELLVMSKCKSNIISNSTFSWWGAWLNRNPEKIVIIPKNNWMLEQRGLLQEDWIKL